MRLFSISSTHSCIDSRLNWYAISLKYLVSCTHSNIDSSSCTELAQPAKLNSAYKPTMKFQLSTLAILGSFVAFAHGVCLKTSGNAHMIPETGDMQIFALIYNNDELVCSINRATYDEEMKLDCHDGHYAIIPDNLGVVMYAHNKVDYQIPIKQEVAGADAWAWNGQLGC